MRKVEKASRTLGLVALCLLGACARKSGPPDATERAAQTAPILEQVLRFEIQQFATAATGAADVTLCLAVRDDAGTSDPGEGILRGLADQKRIRARSSCGPAAPITLVAGPIEWLRDEEVRVKGEYLRPPSTATPLAYRVVWDHDRWVCLGSIVYWEPL